MSSHREPSPGYLVRFETFNIKAVDRARQIKKPIGEGIGVVASPSKPPAKPIALRNKTKETMPLVRCQRFQLVTFICSPRQMDTRQLRLMLARRVRALFATRASRRQMR